MWYATGDICCNTSNGPYFVTWNKDMYSSSVYGLMCLCKAFYTSALDSCNSLSHSCIAGTESSGIVSNEVGLMPMINSYGV
jgi:hypothetical protein